MTDAKTIAGYCKESGFHMLPLREDSIYRLKELTRSESAPKHKDPFDRLLICQAITEEMIFLTHDSLIPGYNVPDVMFVS